MSLADKNHIMINALALYLERLGVNKNDLEQHFTEERKNIYFRTIFYQSNEEVIETAKKMFVEYVEKLGTPEDWEEEQHL